MAYPVFIDQNNVITEAGKQVIEFVEAQFVEADVNNNLQVLNRLSGPIAEYYANVYKLHAISRERWLKDLRQSAENAYDILKYV